MRWLEEVVGPILQIRTAQNLILEGTWQGLHFVCFFGGHTGGTQGFASWLCPGGFRAPYETQGLEPGSAPCRAHALPTYPQCSQCSRTQTLHLMLQRQSPGHLRMPRGPGARV